MDIRQLEKLSFEDSYDRLEKVIEQLEEGDLSLEDSVDLYEEGIQLAQHCDRQLSDAEIRVTELLTSAADEIEEQSFE